MGDECIITRDPELNTDDIWDEDEGTYVAAGSADRVTIYNDICSVYSRRGIEQTEMKGGREVAVTRFYLAIPMDEDVEIKPEDLVEITDVDDDNGDLVMIGTKFRITSQEFGTLSATRRFLMELQQDIP